MEKQPHLLKTGFNQIGGKHVPMMKMRHYCDYCALVKSSDVWPTFSSHFLTKAICLISGCFPTTLFLFFMSKYLRKDCKDSKVDNTERTDY